jgi:hypothetical protein
MKVPKKQDNKVDLHLVGEDIIKRTKSLSDKVAAKSSRKDY